MARRLRNRQTRTPLAKVEKQTLLPTSSLKINGGSWVPTSPWRERPRPLAPGVRTRDGPHGSAHPGPQGPPPLRGPRVLRRRALPPRPRGRLLGRRPGSGLRAPPTAPRETRRWQPATLRFPRLPSPPLPPPPAASALHSRAPAYPQLLEIRHFIPPAGAAAAAVTAPPPATANNAAATTAAAAASSTILHWGPLKTPRPPPPLPPPPGPSRDERWSPAHRRARPRPPNPQPSARVFRPRAGPPRAALSSPAGPRPLPRPARLPARLPAKPGRSPCSPLPPVPGVDARHQFLKRCGDCSVTGGPGRRE